MHRLAGLLIVDIIAEHARDGLPTQRAIRAVMVLVISLGPKGSGRVVECC